MKIAFLLGSTAISGGTNVILEHACGLRDRAHQVFLLTQTEASAEELSWHSGADGLQTMSIEKAKQERFDCVLATWWQSVSLLSQIDASSYIYFVQSIESRFFPEENETVFTTRDIDVLKQWIESTYRYPLPVITEANWIRQYLRARYNHNPVLVRNGIRKDIYSAAGPVIEERIPGQLRVLVEGPLGVFYKNVEKTIELCRKAGIDDIWLLTSSAIDHYSGATRCFSQVSIKDTADIYRSCDVLVKLSTVEGMFGPPLEMFHCGGTAIVYDVTGYDEYIEHRKNSLVVKMHDDGGVVEGLKELKDNAELLTELKKGALETAAGWPDWSVATEMFAQAVEELSGIKHFVTRQLLEEHDTFFLNIRESSFRAREMKRLAERESIPSGSVGGVRNFIQVYWHDGGGFRNEKMIPDLYVSETWCRCNAVLPEQDRPVSIRIDPAVRIGIISVKQIRVSDAQSDRTLKKWDCKRGFNGLHLSGTAKLICIDQVYTILAYGEDPQIILPGVFAVTLRQNIN